MVYCKLRPAGWFDIFLFSVGIYRKFRVSGNSMLPVLKNDDVVLSGSSKDIKTGDIVICQHPFQNKLLIKHVERVTKEGCYVSGFANSTDSSSFGSVARKDVVGIVKCIV